MKLYENPRICSFVKAHIKGKSNQYLECCIKKKAKNLLLFIVGIEVFMTVED